ncbi:MAG: DUF433 domain-containing protein [Candidatus Heimdallarchaeota archaeon]
MIFNRIAIDPNVMGGTPCIRDTRIPVSIIIKLLAKRETFEKIISDYPELIEEDILASLEYAAWSVSEKSTPVFS